MSVLVWLEDIGIIHMGSTMTPLDYVETGYTSLSMPDMVKLARIIQWLDTEKLVVMMFWRWKQCNTSDVGTEQTYWRLCPCITFFKDEEAAYFKLTWL